MKTRKPKKPPQAPIVDHFFNYRCPELWCIREEEFNPTVQNVRESQFAQGNGFLGLRGILEENPEGSWPGTFLSGIYDRMTSQVAELVNFPNPLNLKLSIGGEKVGVTSMDVVTHTRILNMRDGLLLRHSVYADSRGRRYDYQSMRFVSMHNRSVGAMQVVFTPLDGDVDVDVQKSIDVGVSNIWTVTEGRKQHFHVTALMPHATHNTCIVETLEGHHNVVIVSGLRLDIGDESFCSAANIHRLKVAVGQSLVLTRVFAIGGSPENGAALRRLSKSIQAMYLAQSRRPFTDLVDEHVREWNRLWERADVEIEATFDIQKNLRFNIYHMLCCAHVDDGYSSIGARTLSGEGYRGHIFWDAEIYLLPFYLHTLPDVARNMLLYRHRRLDPARDIANVKGYRGAMFPWESAGTGEEETPRWARDLDRTIIAIKTDELEHHITADIAYATVQYAELTGDVDFMDAVGCELVFECARFWASRVQQNRKGGYEIRNVIGPDEFHEHVDNNVFTNEMARWNLRVAHRIFGELRKRNPRIFRSLTRRIGLKAHEVNGWIDVAERIAVNRVKEGVIEEFDGFFKKRFVEITEFDENNIPQLPEGLGVQDYQETQLVKQADVLMLQYLLPDAFTPEQKAINYQYYMRRTLHKSSLSAAIHALMALETGDMAQAYQFFNVALRADISDLHGNSHEGIHAASLGGVWQSVIHGFAGVRFMDGILHIDPKLPRTWPSVRFRLMIRGEDVTFDVRHTEVRVRLRTAPREPVDVCVYKKMEQLVAEREYVFAHSHRERDVQYY